MARYNEFVFTTPCPHCGTTKQTLFQADIGSLEWRVFEVGEQVLDIPLTVNTPIYGAGPDNHNADYWSVGLAVCSDCHRDIWAQVCVRKKHFDTINILAEQPADMYGWGYL